MAESASSLRKSKTNKVLTESDMVAAQQLMQLSSDDDNSTNINININKNKNTDEEIDQNPSEGKIRDIFGNEDEVLHPRKRRYWSLDEEIDRNPSEITSAKIKEIFGNEEEVMRLRKRRYRSLVHIYMMTKPMNVRHGKKRSY